MNIKNYKQFSLSILFVLSLLFITPKTVALSGKEKDKTPNDLIGHVSTSKTNAIPYLHTGRAGILGGVHQLPGGGTATVTANLGWTAARMEGAAITQLSSNTYGTFSICAKAVQMYKNGVQKGGAGQVCGSRTGGGSISSTQIVYEYVFGSTWRVDTTHGVTAQGFSWYPSQTISVTP